MEVNFANILGNDGIVSEILKCLTFQSLLCIVFSTAISLNLILGPAISRASNSGRLTNSVGRPFSIATMEVNFANILGNDGIVSEILKCLTFRDLRSLSVASKMAHSTVSKTVALWPPKFIQFLRTYCTGTPSSFLVASVNSFDDEGNRICPHPIIRLVLDDLGYDVERKKLIGNPWSRVSSQPIPRDSEFGIWCFADNGRSKVFWSRGIEARSENPYLFDTKLGTWTKLPPMPEFGMVAAGVFRVRSRIYVLLKNGASILCFDLEINQWVDSGIHTFPGDAITDFATVVLNDGTVIVAGGEVLRADDWSQQVFALNTSTGVWTQMPDLPEIFSDDEHPLMGYCITTADHPDGLAVVMGNNTWVLLVDGRWDVNPILQGTGLKALRLGDHQNKVFVRDGFIELPTQENVDGATVEFSSLNNYWIVR